MYLLFLWGVVCLVFVLLRITVFPFYFCNLLDEKERAGCFALIVVLVSCDYLCSVAFPHSGMVCSV